MMGKPMKLTLTKMVLLMGDNHKAGFVLSEVLLAGAILSIALASCITVIGSWQSMIVDTDRAFQALILARAQLAQLHSVSFIDLALGQKNNEKQNADFATDVSVSYRNSFLAEVSIEISWFEGQLRKRRAVTDEIVDWKNAVGAPQCDWLDHPTKDLSLSSSNLNADEGNPLTNISVQGDFAYVSANGTTTSLSDLYVLNISDIQHPKIIGQLNTGPGIASLVAVDNYVFIANAGSYQFQIVDVTDPTKPTLVSQAKLPGVTVSGGAGFGQSIAYFDHKIYLGLVKASGPEFQIVDVANPRAPVALGSYEIGSTVNSIAVEAGRALIGTPSAQSLILFDVSRPADIKILDQTTLTGWQTQGVQSVALLGSQVYVGRALGGFYSPKPEFLDLDRDALSSVNSTLPIDASVDDIFVYGDYIYLATSNPEKAFEVVRRAVGTAGETQSINMTLALSDRAVAISCNAKALYVVTQNAQNFLHILN